MSNKDLVGIINYYSKDRGIPLQTLVSIVEMAAVKAYSKLYQDALVDVRAEYNAKSGELRVFCTKEVVANGKVRYPENEIEYKQAIEIDPDCRIQQKPPYEVEVELKASSSFYAVQSATQYILDELRKAERDVVYQELSGRIGSLVSGTITRTPSKKGRTYDVNIGREITLKADQLMRGEHPKVGDRIQGVLIESVSEEGRKEVQLSRLSEKLPQLLFVEEVEELKKGVIVIERIAREPGVRTKIAVSTTDTSKVDTKGLKGAMIGMGGMRIQAVSRALSNEKIDIFLFSKDPMEMLQNMLENQKDYKIKTDGSGFKIYLIVADDEYPKVLGKGGNNIRLMAKMLGDERYEITVEKKGRYICQLREQVDRLLSSDSPLLGESLRSLLPEKQLAMQLLENASVHTAEDLLKKYAAAHEGLPVIEESLEGIDNNEESAEEETISLKQQEREVIPGLSTDLINDIVEHLIGLFLESNPELSSDDESEIAE